MTRDPRIGFDTVVRWLEQFGTLVAAVCLVVIALITVIDVFCRYALGTPIGWAYPLISHYLLAALFFGVVSATQRERHHVSMDAVMRLLSPAMRRILSALGMCIMLGFCVLIVVTGYKVTKINWLRGAGFGGIYDWARWPADILVPLGIGLFAARIVADLLLQRELLGETSSKSVD